MATRRWTRSLFVASACFSVLWYFLAGTQTQQPQDNYCTHEAVAFGFWVADVDESNGVTSQELSSYGWGELGWNGDPEDMLLRGARADYDQDGALALQEFYAALGCEDLLLPA